MGRRNSGTAPKGGWAPGENRYRATPTRVEQVARTCHQARMGTRKKPGGSHGLGKWFLALSSIIGQNNGHLRAQAS